MNEIVKYIKEIFGGFFTLLTGMKVTAKYFFTPWKHVTQQYPENRATLKIADRFRGEVVMPHNENNEHKCTGCGICELNCPNGTIEIISKMELTAEGKKKKAIVMSKNFEHAVWDRSELTKVLNKPGSKLMEGVKE